MDFNILYAIQNMHTPLLDKLIVSFANITGSYGQIWVVIGVVLLLFKKTRKAGICVILSYLLVYVVGQYGLKDLIARPRPCHIDTKTPLLVKRPSSYSCPSTHSAWGFAGATSIFLYHKKMGIFAIVLALLIGFSRLYLFVHFPSDVLLGALIGIALAIISSILINKVSNKLTK